MPVQQLLLSVKCKKKYHQTLSMADLRIIMNILSGPYHWIWELIDTMIILQSPWNKNLEVIEHSYASENDETLILQVSL